jgi:hypothetical protein
MSRLVNPLLAIGDNRATSIRFSNSTQSIETMKTPSNTIGDISLVTLAITILMTSVITGESRDRYFYANTLPANMTDGDGTTANTPKQISSSTDPAAAFDNIIGWYVAGYDQANNYSLIPSTETIALHFYPGEYFTDGIHPYHEYVSILGETMGTGNRPVFRLKSNATYNEASGFKYVIKPERYMRDISIRNIEIDCNWQGQTSYNHEEYNYNQSDGGYKLGGVSVQCINGRIDFIKIYNFGSNGQLPFTGSGQEVFPLVVGTGSYDQTVPILISYCTVGNGHFIEGGYTTAISVVTRDPLIPNYSCAGMLYPGSQRPPGCRTATAAIIANNYVHNIASGMAFGVTDSERVLIEDNTAYKVNTGFNCDTVHVSNSLFNTIRNNTFNECNAGINVGGPNSSDAHFADWTITGNTFLLIGHWDNPVAGFPSTLCYGIRLNGQTDRFTISDNRFDSIAYGLFSWDYAYPAPKWFYGVQLKSGCYKDTSTQVDVACSCGTDPDCHNHWNGSNHSLGYNYYQGNYANHPFNTKFIPQY